jgi:uracil-DNA glycosylase family 4
MKVYRKRINTCQKCSQFVPDFAKPIKMERGNAGSIIVVGQRPGSDEIANGRAFSGSSGKKLDKWLKECGANEQNPRQV